MDNKSLLELVQTKLANGEIARVEVEALLGGNVPAQGVGAPSGLAPAAPSGHLGASKIFFYLGGLIILIGITVFVSQFWADLGPAGRIAVSLGSAVVAFALGVFFSRMREPSELAAPFHLIGGVLFPFGAQVLLVELGVSVTLGTWVLLFLALTLLYAAAAFAVEYVLVTFFLVAYATVFLFTLAEHVLQDALIPNWHSYFGMLIGVSYLYLGKQFQATRNAPISRFLLLVGSVWFLGASFWLYSSLPLWPLIYPVLVAGMIAFSLSVKSMSVLVISALSIMSYVAYITGKYFADSLGWPLALVLIGFAFIGIGYATFYARRTYLHT
ncbi:MAG TPA: hypothetical protein VGB97_03145 [Candidatus Paceibacterota bacterium]|jgi:hypothetical protein